MMLKYFRFGDEPDAMSAQEALMLWVKSQVNGYKGFKIGKSFKGTFANGLALCAIIHKHRPDLIDFDALDPDDPAANLDIAFNAATEYFGLDAGIVTTDEFGHLNEATLIVYLSEYYEGIANTSKLELATVRIHKLVDFTRGNDTAMADIIAKSADIDARLTAAEALLRDRSTDGTLEGAIAKVARLDRYKASKGPLLGDHFRLGSASALLAARLEENKRGRFAIPTVAHQFDALDARIGNLTELERVEDDLMAELNRQYVIAEQDKRHAAAASKIGHWIGDQEEWIGRAADAALSDAVTPSADVRTAIKMIEVSISKVDEVADSEIGELRSMSAEIDGGRGTPEATAREAELVQRLASLKADAPRKIPTLADQLEREKEREATELSAKVHAKMVAQVLGWAADRKAYLTEPQAPHTTQEAQYNETLFATYRTERADAEKGSVAAVLQLGATINAASYISDVSSWHYAGQAAIAEQEASIAVALAGLDELAVAKLAALHDDLARTAFDDETALLVKQHASKAAELLAWGDAKLVYTQDTADESGTVAAARSGISAFQLFQEFASVSSANYRSLQALGATIEARQYRSPLSTHAFEDGDLLQAAEAKVDARLAAVKAAGAAKLPILNADLEIALLREKVLLWIKLHNGLFDKIFLWTDDKKEYLLAEDDPAVDTVHQVREAMNALTGYRKEKANMLAESVAEFKDLGAAIVSAYLKTERGEWRYPDQDEVLVLGRSLDDAFAELEQCEANMQVRLDDALAREQCKQETRLRARSHAELATRIAQWCHTSMAYLGEVDTVKSSVQAKEGLGNLAGFIEFKQLTEATDLATLHAIGAKITAARWETSFSSWSFRADVVEVQAREVDIARLWDELATRQVTKQLMLDDALAREQFAEHTQLLAEQYRSEAEMLIAWGESKLRAYLRVKTEGIGSVADARYHLSVLNAFTREYGQYTTHQIMTLEALIGEIEGRRYKSEYSDHAFDEQHRSELRMLGSQLSGVWFELDEASLSKSDELDDSLARESTRERVELMCVSHTDMLGKIMEWVGGKVALLSHDQAKAEEAITSVPEALRHLASLEAFVQEKGDYEAGMIDALIKMGKGILSTTHRSELSSWEWPRPEAIADAEASLDKDWGTLLQLADSKKARLADHLARESFRERTRLQVENHAAMYDKLNMWAEDRQEYLTAREALDSGPESNTAQVHQAVNVLNATIATLASKRDGAIASLGRLGDEIRRAEHSGPFSSWAYETPEDVSDLEAQIAELWSQLEAQAAKKRAWLSDDLERERYKADVGLWMINHRAAYKDTKQWCSHSIKKLATKEVVGSSESAKKQLNWLDAFVLDTSDMQTADVAAFRATGERIRTARYDGEFSVWACDPARATETTEAEAAIDFDLAAVLEGTAAKRAVLEDDEKRELYKEESLSLYARFADRVEALNSWIDANAAYLVLREPVETTQDAMHNLNLLVDFEQEREAAAASLSTTKALAETVRRRMYESDYSTYVFRETEEVDKKESTLDERWGQVGGMIGEKRKVAEDHVARTLFQDATMLRVREHAHAHAVISGWTATQLDYLTHHVDITSVRDARLHVNILDAFDRQKADILVGAVEDLKALGAQIRTEGHTSNFSTWSYGEADAVEALEAEIDGSFGAMDTEARKLRAELLDALERETYKESVLVLVKMHAGVYTSLAGWAEESEALFDGHEAADGTEAVKGHLAHLDAFLTQLDDKKRGMRARMASLLKEIAATEHRSAFSQWTYSKEGVAVLGKLETSIDAAFATLGVILAQNRELLEDDLAREQHREALALQAATHERVYNQIMAWADEKIEFLAEQASVKTATEARVQLSILEAYDKEYTATTSVTFGGLAALGAEIVGSVYSSSLSEYAYEAPEDLEARALGLQVEFAELHSVAIARRGGLDDDLKRSLYQDQITLSVARHATFAAAIGEWIAERIRGSFARDAPLDALEAVKVQESQLESIVLDMSDVETGRIRSLIQMGADLTAATWTSELSQWTFDRGNEIAATHAGVAAAWAELQGKVAEHRDYLADAHRREVLRVDVDHLLETHLTTLVRLKAWNASKIAFLELESAVDTVGSVGDVEMLVRMLKQFANEKALHCEVEAESLDAIDAQVTAIKHVSPTWGGWSYERMPELRKTEDPVRQGWVRIDGRIEARREQLAQWLVRETDRETLKLEYANAASSFEHFARDTLAGVKRTRRSTMSHGDLTEGAFGSLLDEVRRSKKAIDDQDARFNDEASARFGLVTAVADELVAAGVDCAVHAQGKLLADLEAQRAQLDAALADRQAHYAQELSRVTANDQLARTFADVAKPLVKRIGAKMRAILRRDGSLEDQLGAARRMAREVERDRPQVAELHALGKQMDDAGIEHNPHTGCRAAVVQAEFETAVEIIGNRIPLLEEEIRAKNANGLTQEQHVEMVEKFKLFDTDASGTLTRYEVRSCLFSLGDETHVGQIDEAIKELGGAANGGLTLEQFKVFMAKRMGRSFTMEQMEDTMGFLSGDTDTVTKEVLRERLTVEDYGWLTSQPATQESKTGDGYLWRPWIDGIFADRTP